MLKTGPIHESFVQEILGTTPSKLKNIWKELIFTGKGAAPKIFKTDNEMIEYVANTTGAIGYADASLPLGRNVKVISVR